MLKSVVRTMLTNAMGFAWDMIKAGERIVAAAERWELHEGNEQRAGCVELSVHQTGRAIVGAGEHLELRVNALAMRFGYNNGEVSDIVARSFTPA